jgi:zinc D-Ala-D-Ala carboxypeptidase
MSPAFMDSLEQLRSAYGKPMPITSGYRCPKHNAAVSNTGGDGPHTTGRAADIGVRGSDAKRLLSEALKLGFTGIGINQKGNARFIHVDDLPNGATCPRPTVWSY